ncbi:HNH endonuclease signature motif containing protein, partial [Nocardioides sp.]|uniref:HNH endonuclease signature motif containing protein n=1 Tax=Nocardioides sp. TaxID=35761 RepID=UPI00344E6A00
MRLDHLTADLETAGVATLETGDAITAGQARRLACQAKTLPAVLGGTSEVLDLGRTRRLHSSAQRKAIRLSHPHCQADGCTVPAAWCETHHRDPWSHGAKTDLTNAALLSTPPPPPSPPHPLPHPTASPTATTASTDEPRP